MIKILLIMFLLGIILISAFLASGHPGLAVKITNYVYIILLIGIIAYEKSL